VLLHYFAPLFLTTNVIPLQMIGEITDCVAVCYANQDSVRFVIFQKTVRILYRDLQSSFQRFPVAYSVVLHLYKAVAVYALLSYS
jgi:hypothetical protein